MRGLRERLAQISSAPPEPRQEKPKPAFSGVFCREHRVPLSALRGIENVTLEDIRACDPSFEGTSWDMEKLLFLDTETTGLSGGTGTVAFEIGAGFIRGDRMIIRQFIMRDYHEEAAVLAELAGMFSGICAVVSFNGKSFDLPLLESRMTMNRIRLAVTKYPHFDLLHAVRRVYRLRLGRCSLSAVEEAVLDLHREDDLPGAQVPQRYFDYLKTGEFALLEDVLRHNLQDVQSLAELTGHLCSIFRTPERLAYSEDRFGVGKTLLRTGRTEQGRRCLHLIRKGKMAEGARRILADSYKKEKNWEPAVAGWQEMISHGEGGILPYVELAKYCEHIEKDTERALRYTYGAIRYQANMALLGGSEEETDRSLEKRLMRLRKKAEKEAAQK